MKLNYLLIFIVLLYIPTALAHESDDLAHQAEHEQEAVYGSNDFTLINPIHYFTIGEVPMGLVMLFFWVLIIYGIYNLTLLVLGRLSSR